MPPKRKRNQAPSRPSQTSSRPSRRVKTIAAEEGSTYDGKALLRGPDAWKWTHVDEEEIITYSTSDEAEQPPNSKIAAFDMDSTLITTRGKHVFPKGRTDWQWLFPCVPAKLQKLLDDGYKVVIFSNQLGISRGKNSASTITGKIMDMFEQADLRLPSVLALTKNHSRKPNMGMYDYFVHHMNGGVHADPSTSFYCGDAAGRPAAWDGKKATKKDHSCDDRKFSHNIGIPFHTPEEFFLDGEPSSFDWRGFNPADVEVHVKGSSESKEPPPQYTGELCSTKQELIINVGWPGSGKSTFVKEHLIPHGYVWVNGDQLGNKKPKCMKAVKEALTSGSSVVLDNTSPSTSVRAQYLALAEKCGVERARCFFFDTPRDVSEHLNGMRNAVHGTKRVPQVAYNMYKKHFVTPSTDEGFLEVKHISFVPIVASQKELDDFKRFYSIA